MSRPRSVTCGGILPRWLASIGMLAALAGCAPVPPVQQLPPTFEQKMTWILRLEDRRVLREEPERPAVVEPRSGRAAAVAPPQAPDLLTLLSDPDVQIRRRAAIAVGRVGLTEGVEPLVSRLADPEPEVRQMAAFALGLLGDPSATSALVAALSDPAPVVQGRAAQALAQLGDSASAGAIGELAARLVREGQVAQILAENMAYPLDPVVEAFRLAVYGLARLRAYEPLAAAVLAENAQPLVRWWPVAYALGEIADPRSLPALITFARAGGPGAVFAVRALGTLGNPEALRDLVALVENPEVSVNLKTAAVRAIGQIGDASTIPALIGLAQKRDNPAEIWIELAIALGRLGAPEATELLLVLASHSSPSLRAASLDVLAQTDPQFFVSVLSGLPQDPDWRVRAALAGTLGRLDPAFGVPRLVSLLNDEDRRVIPSALGSLEELQPPQTDVIVIRLLQDTDAAVRMAAARAIGELKLAGGPTALLEAYRVSLADASYVARAAILTALSQYGTGEAREALKQGLGDRDWAVRVRAAELLAELTGDINSYDQAIRPAPTQRSPDAYSAEPLVSPKVSPHVYIETEKGVIQIELAVLDAPLTVDNFITLARRGYFDGLVFHRVVPGLLVQSGDPRADGNGGPGYTIRDEPNQVPFLRGTVGMSRDWPGTAGSQFFITRVPQPQLDARYTAFGTVIAGMEVVDQLDEWDVIQRVRVWDGTF